MTTYESLVSLRIPKVQADSTLYAPQLMALWGAGSWNAELLSMGGSLPIISVR
jgi:hypothetical protein